MNNPVRSNPDLAAVLWICWEDGEPIQLAYRDVAERWLRRGNYMHKSISPLSMQSEHSQANLLAQFSSYGGW